MASDPDNRLGRRLGILYSFDAASRQAAQSKDITGTWELPQPTVVVIDDQGQVAFAEVSPDWLVRTEAEPVLDVVRGLLKHRALQIAI